MSVTRALYVALLVALVCFVLPQWVSAESDSPAALPRMVDIVNRQQRFDAKLGRAKPKAKTAVKGKAIHSFLLPGQYCPVSFKTPNAATAAAVAKQSAAKNKKRRGARFLQINQAPAAGVPALTDTQLALCKQMQAGAAGAAPAGTPAAPAAPAAPRGQGVGGKKFQSLVGGSTNDQIWNPAVNDKVKSAVHDYKAKTKLPNGLIYGDSVRTLSLIGKSQAQIAASLKKFKCVLDNQQMKNSTTNLPILINGKPVPMPTYICPDGGAIRLKPLGDPTSKFRPQPQGVKTLRYPYNGPFLTFDDEVVKVDAKGNPVPKWTKDLVVQFPASTVDQNDFADAWANAAHEDLKK